MVPDHAAAADLRTTRQAIAAQAVVALPVDGGTINVAFVGFESGRDQALALDWIRNSAAAVSGYFGKFPVARVDILVVAEPGGRVGHATTWGYQGSTIRIGVGRDTGPAAFADDWVLVHEMTHLALPDLPADQLWALEGSATYVEPIARAATGQLDPAHVWRDMIKGMPQGLPEAGDEGLDNTHSWGRTYWGGALYYLAADISIRKQTNGRFGLRDALRAINHASGGNSANWTMAKFVAVGDRATGTNVLAGLYAEMGNSPDRIDLDWLFAMLGVDIVDDQVRFDDKAELATIREAITTREP
jgi:hypothetical protein